MNSNRDEGALNSVAKGQTRETCAVFQSNYGAELFARVREHTPDSVVFEVTTPEAVLQLSEVLREFRIFAGERLIYSGRAVVNRVEQNGGQLVCEAGLRYGVAEVDLGQLNNPETLLRPGYNAFLSRWQDFYRMLPEYKLAVADMRGFLKELGLWLQEIEIGIRSHPSADRIELERRLVKALFEATTPAITALFERFEQVASAVSPDLVPVHRAYCHQELHPLLLSSPFMHRIFMKPLGYAGDYEMVNMILRDPLEGASLLGKLMNVFILAQVPAEAHRNRVLYLTDRLVQETLRVSRSGRPARFFTMGCGPAGEVQRFLRMHDISNRAEFTLLDMNDETLQYTGGVLSDIKARHGRSTPITLIKNSVRNLVKQSATSGRTNGRQQYDFVYAAGLFDYLNDQICRALVRLAYDMLVPGGTLLVTNVHSNNPIRNIMEHIYEWYLIYRDSEEFKLVAADLPPEAEISVVTEATSSNIILEARKPKSDL